MDHDMIEALDIRFPADHPIPSDGIAYFRIDPKLRDFITLCREKNAVIGFKYEFGELNFGVILGKK